MKFFLLILLMLGSIVCGANTGLVKKINLVNRTNDNLNLCFNSTTRETFKPGQTIELNVLFDGHLSYLNKSVNLIHITRSGEEYMFEYVIAARVFLNRWKWAWDTSQNYHSFNLEMTSDWGEVIEIEVWGNNAEGKQYLEKKILQGEPETL